ncbi:hypothetical protein [Methylocystis sp. ATCC 49242]|uniref:hypothetical protein n=1 Tax=Methylocystis sp. ATCC 49242 TaxID=622637 RepID=UPI0011856114|nr:hypothetical protein [Methylocystis sp. ATCC 49242]
MMRLAGRTHSAATIYRCKPPHAAGQQSLRHKSERSNFRHPYRFYCPLNCVTHFTLTASLVRTRLNMSRRRNPQDLWILVIMLLVNPAASAAARCFESNGVHVCYNNDESVFYDTPENEVAYSVQTIRDEDNYYTIYHSEPMTKYRTGDAVKAGVHRGKYALIMPPHEFRLWGTDKDPGSLIASNGVGGAANPIAISGLRNDPYFYVFFLGVNDDEQLRDHASGHWRHYLLEARTTDFVSFDLKTDSGWTPFSTDVRPAPLRDSSGAVIRSNSARRLGHTQGLIGSISFVNGLYHFFYFDYGPEGESVNLYLRTSVDVSKDGWSPQKIVIPAIGLRMVRLAKAKNLDRWVAMYGCYVRKRQDICAQYTQNLNVMGPGGVSDLRLTSEFALGLSDNGSARSYAQPYWLTDRWGNLDAPNAGQSVEFYWTDMTPSNCLAHPHPFCPVYGGAVYRGSWSVRSDASAPRE